MNRFLNGWIEQLESQAETLAAQGHHQQAADVRRRLCDGMMRHLGEAAPPLMDAMEALATDLRLAGALNAAETVYRRRLRLILRNHGPQHRAFARGLNQLGVLYCEMGRYRRAVGLYRRLFDGLKTWEAIDAPSRAALHHNLANAYQALGRHHPAQEHYTSACGLMQGLGPSLEHALCLCDLAESVAMDRPGRAQGLLAEALVEVRQVLAKTPADLARTLIRIAGSYFRLHQGAMADELLQESIVLLESAPREPGELRHCRGLLRKVRESTPQSRADIT